MLTASAFTESEANSFTLGVGMPEITFWLAENWPVLDTVLVAEVLGPDYCMSLFSLLFCPYLVW